MKEKKMPYFSIYRDKADLYLLLPDAQLGAVFRSGLEYFVSRKEPEEIKPDTLQGALTKGLIDSIDQNFDSYEAMRQGGENSVKARNPKAPSSTFSMPEASSGTFNVPPNILNTHSNKAEAPSSTLKHPKASYLRTGVDDLE